MIRLVRPTLEVPEVTVERGSGNGLDGAVVALLANGKPNGKALLDVVVDVLGAAHELAGVVRVTKANPSLPPSAEELELLAGADVAISAIGDCGSCSSGTVRDGIELAKRGLATTVVVTDAFVAPSRAMAALCGIPDYRFAVVPHPTANLSGDELAAVGAAAARQVEAILAELA